MNMFERYAIYWLPESGPLAEFGASWLGWDIARGIPAQHPDCDLDLDRITKGPRRYGFHATLKPPFQLASDSSFDALVTDFRALATVLNSVLCPGLKLSRLGRFLALTPKVECPALNDLAAESVRTLDTHRRPNSAAEMAKRRANGLTARQDENLIQFGYPYVLDDFRFHLTLTERLPKPELPVVEALLLNRLPPLPDQFQINSLCLVGEDADGRFHLIERCSLRDSPYE